jgi:hypothetical protein
MSTPDPRFDVFEPIESIHHEPTAKATAAVDPWLLWLHDEPELVAELLGVVAVESLPVSECPQQETLITYAYGECSTAERTRFESHLYRCVTCANEIESIALIQAALDEVSP